MSEILDEIDVIDDDYEDEEQQAKLTDEELIKRSRIMNYLDGRNDEGERWDDVVRKRDKDNPDRTRVRRTFTIDATGLCIK